MCEQLQFVLLIRLEGSHPQQWFDNECRYMQHECLQYATEMKLAKSSVNCKQGLGMLTDTLHVDLLTY